MPRFQFDSVVNVAPELLYAWHEQRGAFYRLIPPWASAEVRRYDGVIEGGLVALRVPVGPAKVDWMAEIRDVQAGRQFRDIQIKGPFRSWNHLHSVRSHGDGASDLIDSIDASYPRSVALVPPARHRIERSIEQAFAYRHEVTRNDLARIRQYTYTQPQRIAVSGSGGLVGSALVHFLDAAGHEVYRLVRHSPGSRREILFDYESATVNAGALEGLDAVVHLAGESMASGRWSQEHRMRIHASRVRSTEFLVRTLTKLERRPSALLTGSMVGIYGDRPGETLTDDSAPGEQGFLSILSRDWEEATVPASEAGIRTVNLRFGLVISPLNSIVRLLMGAIRLGLGAKVRAPDTDLSWISMDDALYAIYHLLSGRSVSGPVNIVSTEPTTRRTLIEALASTASNRIRITIPGKAVRYVLGEVAEEAIFRSQHALPNRLVDSGFTHSFPSLERALNHQFGHVATSHADASVRLPNRE